VETRSQDIYRPNGGTLVGMRKPIALLLMGIVMLFALAAPAFAQARDPFDPVVTQSQVDTSGGSTGTITGGGTATTDGGPTVVGGTGSDALAATGAETEPWLVLAFLLITIGAGVLFYAKVARQTA
jgi:hypothetical protein